MRCELWELNLQAIFFSTQKRVLNICKAPCEEKSKDIGFGLQLGCESAYSVVQNRKHSQAFGNQNFFYCFWPSCIESGKSVKRGGVCL